MYTCPRFVCLNYNVNIDNRNFICSQCKSVYYCSKECQMNSWHKHKILCTSIATLEKKHNRNILQDKSFPTHLSPKEKAKMAKIVGEKCLMQCELSGVPKSVLLDTGAQVSIASEKY